MKPNRVFLIQPYRQNDVWLFSDKNVGLQDEPMVGETNGVIDIMAGGAKDNDRLNIYFSEGFMPKSELITRLPPFEKFGGAWYSWRGIKFWLCENQKRYTLIPPRKLYVRVERA